jgi:hypothetical protein
MVSRPLPGSQGGVMITNKVLNVFDTATVFRSNFANLIRTMSKHPISKTLTLAAIASMVLGFNATADETKLPPAATKANVTFEADIKPIFDVSCVKCHGNEKPKAGLKLTSLEATLKGTKEGKVVEPGNSAKSSLVLSVAYIGEEDHWMPPKDNKAKIAPLTKEQVGLVRAWVDQGAK